jgi:hypothetical protein
MHERGGGVANLENGVMVETCWLFVVFHPAFEGFLSALPLTFYGRLDNF